MLSTANIGVGCNLSVQSVREHGPLFWVAFTLPVGSLLYDGQYAQSRRSGS